MTVVVGLDLSLASTGAARIDTAAGDVKLQRIQSKPRARRKDEPAATLTERGVRLRRITTQALTLCQGARLVTVEGPAFASSGAGTWDRAGFWWLVVNSLLAARVPLVEVPPSNVKIYATGKGNADKDTVLASVVRRYPDVEVDGNDVADGLVLAAMAARFIGHPLEPSMPQTHLRGMDNVHWTV